MHQKSSSTQLEIYLTFGILLIALFNLFQNPKQNPNPDRMIGRHFHLQAPAGCSRNVCCKIVRDVFEPFGNDIDYVLLGGERNVLQSFRERCRLMQDLGPKILTRTLRMNTPNQATLKNIAFEVWKSRVLTLELVDDR